MSKYLDGYSYGSARPSLTAQASYRQLARQPSKLSAWIADQVQHQTEARKAWSAACSCPEGPEQDSWMAKAVSHEKAAAAIERRMRANGW